MSWTVEITLDADKATVGTAAAIWNAGEADAFTYSRRATVSGADANAFVAEAEAALTARDTKAASEASLVTALEGLLNA